MENKINYQKLMETQIENIKKELKKPQLLLHSCCAPCSTAVLEQLLPYFKITIYYYNPNTYPEKEYENRLIELKSYIEALNLQDEIEIIEPNYDSNEFYKIASGLEKELEGKGRCFECYKLRLEHTAQKAVAMKMDYYTTVLSISPHKNSKWINELGNKLGEKYGIEFLYADFKKKNGFKRSIEISKKYDLYRQDYCGCIYSMSKYEEVD